MSTSIKPEFYLSWIPMGKINFTPQIYASVVFVPHVEKVSADTSRNLSKLENVPADATRKIGRTENTRADFNRNVKNLEKAVADTSRKMGIVFAIADSCRIVKNVSITTADTLRKVDTTEKIIADSFRKVAVREKISADSFLKITATEKAFADTSRRMLDRTTADTFRKVLRPEKSSADTVIRYPHVLNLLAQDSIVNSFKDYQATRFEISLNERTLSDSFSLETARQININDAVQGTFLDYPYSFLAEETTEQDRIFSVKGMYDVDKLLYSFIETDLRGEKENYLDGVIYYAASSYVSKIAGYLGLTPNIKIEDFTPYNVVGNTNITYSDLISSLFSWTSRLPQRQINVFIRGKTLHCIQRGLEDSVFDVSDIPHSRPKVNKKLIRSMYNSPFGDNELSEETKNIPFTGTISYSDTFSITLIHYLHGLLQKEYSRFLSNVNGENKESTNSSTYGYISSGSGDNQVFYLSHKNTVVTEIDKDSQSKTETIIDTVYTYSNASEGGLYMYKECEVTVKNEFLEGYLTDEEKNVKETFHTPVGNGWYSTTVFENGEHQGSTISQGKPSNEVSLYTIQQVRKSFGATNKDNTYEAQRSRLAAIADISFPVRELDLLAQLTEDLKWLNRKIQVTVFIDLISKVENGVPDLKHVVDFTERVKLDGSEYFLVSNSISFTPRKLIQKLQLVRWTN